MIRQVARREIVTRARSKAYRVSTSILIALTAVFIAGVAVFGADDDPDEVTIDVGLTEPDAALVERATAITSDGVEVRFVDVEGDDDAIADALDDGDVDVVIRSGSTLVWNDEPDLLVQTIVVEALTSLTIEARAADLGIDDATLAELLAPLDLDVELLDPPTDSDTARTVIATIGVFIMFFGIQMYGSQIALVVVEEKAYRIVEILLALVRPRDLLAGKVLGVGVLAAIQVAVPVVGLFVALAVSGTADIPASAYLSLPLMLVTFALGFTLYGTLFALVGSLVSRQEDAQQALFPIFVPIIVGYLLALQAVAAPDSLLASIAGVVPLTAPFALPVLAAQGTASVPLVAASLALLAAATAGMLALAARIYEFTLLRTGSRITFGRALRLARR